MATLAAFAIVANALFFAKRARTLRLFSPLGHCCGMVALPPRLQPPQSTAAIEAGNQAKLIANIQRELSRKGFYDGPVLTGSGAPKPMPPRAILSMPPD